MTFADALEALKAGKKVRRQAWFNDVEYIYAQPRADGLCSIMIHWKYAQSDTLWEAAHHELFAEDWVVVE